jgi:hypothetical protein
MKIKKFIEENFLIDNAVTGAFVPFTFNAVQDKYFNILINEYGEDLEGSCVREMILKARKEGFTSLILGIFACLDLHSTTAGRSLEISYKEDATRQHFRRYKNYILSSFQPNPSKWDKSLEQKIFKSSLEGSELVLNHNLASFYVGTASTRTGERGGTVQRELFSEEAHYQNTGIIRASEIVNGTASMVAVGHGMIFRETTANGFNHFRKSWTMAKQGELNYKPRFFSYKEFYTPEQFEQIKLGFSDKSLVAQEFPENETEAFLASGRPHFNQAMLANMAKEVTKPFGVGDLKDDKHTIEFVRDEVRGKLTLFMPRRQRGEYLIAADVAGGIPEGAELVAEDSDHRAWSVGAVFDRSSWEVVAQLRLRCDPGEFGRMLCVLGEYFNWAILVPEANNHGAATIEAIKAEEYPHLLYTTDLWKDEAKHAGFPTNGKTKAKIVTAVKNAIDNQAYKENSLVAIEEMQAATYADDGTMVSQGGFLDCVITRGIGLYCLQFLTVDETVREAHHSKKSPLVVSSVAGRPRGRAGYR